MPIDAILFGGRRKTTIPLVTEARDWTHGTFMGATLSSETTAAATGAVGVVRRDPMAMLPFIGYNAADYFNHWITVGKEHEAHKLPRIFYVNWFRRDDDGGFLWPGFGENSRVLKWCIERIEGKADAVETPIGYVPTPESLDVDGLDMTREELEAALDGGRRRVARGAPADHRVVRQVRRQDAGRAVDRARRSAGQAGLTPAVVRTASSGPTPRPHGGRPPAFRQVSRRTPSVTVDGAVASGLVAGPRATSPLRSNLDPWQGQLIVPSSIDATRQPA